jgi:alpha-D-ribose 1-methylphosphonate 5-triphosphate synthase subunit PhnG
VTRCALRLEPEGGEAAVMGVAAVAGRSKRHAELAAAFDALLQRTDRHAALEALLLAPLEAAADARRSGLAARAAATRVEFFTMVRGDD